jgi:dUTP pyrophosphatase
MEIRFKKLHPLAKVPTKAHPTEDAGWDLYSVEQCNIGGDIKEIPTGIALEIPKGFFCLIMPRSSYGRKGFRVHPGTIDSGFRGEITVFMQSVSKVEKLSIIEPGDKIAQLLVLPVVDCQFIETQELSPSERGEKGFGSSGK